MDLGTHHGGWCNICEGALIVYESNNLVRCTCCKHEYIKNNGASLGAV